MRKDRPYTVFQSSVFDSLSLFCCLMSSLWCIISENPQHGSNHSSRPLCCRTTLTLIPNTVNLTHLLFIGRHLRCINALSSLKHTSILETPCRQRNHPHRHSNRLPYVGSVRLLHRISKTTIFPISRKMSPLYNSRDVVRGGSPPKTCLSKRKSLYGHPPRESPGPTRREKWDSPLWPTIVSPSTTFENQATTAESIFFFF